MVLYGQIIIGAPGAGKTTYCDGMQQYLRLLGRECYVVNLDPANEVPLAADGKSTDDDISDEAKAAKEITQSLIDEGKSLEENKKSKFFNKLSLK